jgi:aldose 1-epimerase
MSRYTIKEGKFGKYPTVLLSDGKKGETLEVVLRGATALRYLVNYEGKIINILDGFETQDELEAAKGARCWIMAPFANRIQNGKYYFNGTDYELSPIPPRDQVMHGFLSNIQYELYKTDTTENSIEATFVTKKTRPGVFSGYPFSLDVYVKYKLEDGKLSCKIIGENVGEEPLPFGSGWHSYLKTGDEGIEHLILTLDAEKTIAVDSNLIPLSGENAFVDVINFPHLDFRSDRLADKRILKNKKLDNAFTELKKCKDGFSKASLYDPHNGLKITLFQRGGVTLVFTGDSLKTRPRKAVAIEPMQFITNVFNRDDFKDEITVLPGRNSVFEFGIEINN